MQAALDWLGTPPNDDPQVELVALCAHLADATAAVLPPLQWHTVLELFHGRANGVNDVLKPALLEAALPLSRRLRMIAQGLVEAHGALAAGYLRVLREGEPDKLDKPRRNQAVLCSRAIHHLAEQQEISLLVAAPTPTGLWSQALAVFRTLKEAAPENALPADATPADRTFKRMLALAGAQAETFAAREVAFLGDYLRTFASGVDIRFSGPVKLDEWYWVSERSGSPVAAVRRTPPADEDLVYFSCRLLAENALSQLERLAAKERPEAFGLPSLAAAAAYRAALAHAAERWASPPKRHFHRRRASYRVQVCSQLSALWQLLEGKGAVAASPEGMPITDWMVLNESAGGFAMMHVAGDVSGIVAGAALGMRAGDEPWRLCLVRWARSDNAEHVELGLELVAPNAKPVQIARSAADAKPSQALLLPSLPRLDRGEALMTARGHYSGGQFTLISESDGKVQFTECVAKGLAMQTAAVEVFEFARDFSPV